MRRSAQVALICGILVSGLTLAALWGRLTSVPNETAIRWHLDHIAFGGWSGIEVSEDGRLFWAITDGGTITTGQLLRDGTTLNGVKAPRPHWIKGPGQQRKNGYLAGDSEGLARGQDGRLYVSYEGHHRVRSHADWRAQAEPLTGADAFEVLGFNSGLEALAISPSGRLIAVAEGSVLRPGPVRVYALSGKGWETTAEIETSWPWLAVGADFGPDGVFYLLERQFLGVGFASRVRAFDRLEGAGTTVWHSPLGRYSNLEGLAVWHDPAGQTRLTMVSDDNYQPFMRTQIVEAVLPKELASRAKSP